MCSRCCILLGRKAWVTDERFPYFYAQAIVGCWLCWVTLQWLWALFNNVMWVSWKFHFLLYCPIVLYSYLLEARPGNSRNGGYLLRWIRATGICPKIKQVRISYIIISGKRDSRLKIPSIGELDSKLLILTILNISTFFIFSFRLI